MEYVPSKRNPKNEGCFIRVSTGIPGYGFRTEMIRQIFSISIMDKVPEFWNDFRNDFPENRKFPERCSGITERYGILFRKTLKNLKLM